MKRPSSKISRRGSLNYYRSNKSSGASPFQRRQKSRRRGFLARLIDWLTVLALIAGLIYGLALQSNPKVILNSEAYHSPREYHQVAQTSLKNFKNRNKLTFDATSLTQALKEKFPEISQVGVELPLFGRAPTIRIEVDKPSLALKPSAENSASSPSLIVDAKGTVVGSISSFSSIGDLTLINDESGVGASVGQSILSQSEVNFILVVVAQAKRARVPIQSLTLPKLAQQLDLRTTDRTYFVKFYLGGDALTQSGQFLAARQHFDKTNRQPSAYLDVRVNGKVFYK